jgi:hypothetical protein
VRFSKFGALCAVSGVLVLGGATACDVVNNAPAAPKQQIHEGYRATLEKTVTGLGFTGATAVIEDETKTVAPTATATTTSTKPGKTNPSTTPKKSTAPAIKKSETVKVIELLAGIPGTNCRINVEQTLEPQVGKPYLAEIVLPDTVDAKGAVVSPGKEIDIPADMRPEFTVLGVFNYAQGVAGCAIPGVTVPTLVVPSASGTAGMGASPAATS